jgi:hypothetical protein
MSKGDHGPAAGHHVAPTQDGGGVTPPLAGLGAVLPERYVDQGVIGTGGMGEVHRVYDRVLNRSLAMKVMRGELAAHPVARGRFLREAQITAGLQHPGIVAVHDQGEVAGRLWYTMQEVRGQTLAGAGWPEGQRLPSGESRRRREAAAAGRGAGAGGAGGRVCASAGGHPPGSEAVECDGGAVW